MSEKILSVVIPSYNMENYLPKCLGSLEIAHELMERLEVLVVNDGSTDRTSEIAHEFAAKWPQSCRVIDKENGHYGSCINVALSSVRGEYVKILDADDSFDRQGLEDFVRFLQTLSDPPDLVLSDFVVVNECDQVTQRDELPLPAGSNISIDQFLGASRAILMPAYTYRTAIFRDLGYCQLEHVPYTDTEWIFLPLVRVKTCIRYPHAVYRYMRGRAEQTTASSAYAKNWESYGLVALDMVRQLQSIEHMTTQSIRQVLRRRLLGTVEMVYRGGLFGVQGYPAKIDLRQFDKKLWDLDESLYQKVGGQVYSRRFPCRFIRAWRKSSCLCSAMLFFCRLYTHCCRLWQMIARGLMRKWKD